MTDRFLEVRKLFRCLIAARAAGDIAMEDGVRFRLEDDYGVVVTLTDEFGNTVAPAVSDREAVA